MRQVPNGKRSRNRPGRNNRPSNSRNQTFDSSGPEGKVRGTANQVYEKYLALARDAQSAGDRIGAENFFQHAEHYFRILAANGQQMRPRPMNGFEDDFGDDDSQPGSQPGGQPAAHAAGQSAAPSAAVSDQPQPPHFSPRPAQAAPQPAQGNGHEQPQPPRRETPAQLAQAAAANEESRGGRERGRRGRRPNEDTGAEVAS